MEDFLVPIEKDFVTSFDFSPYQLGYHIKKYVNGSSFPEMEENSIALFGLISSDQHVSLLQKIRPHLYALMMHFPGVNIYDLGDIWQGQTFEDTSEAITQVVLGCISKQVLPIYFGWDHRETIALYNAYERMKRIVNVSVIDATIDLDTEHVLVGNNNWISSLIQRNPSYLFNLAVLGYQSHFVPEELVELMEKLYFDTLRVGKIHNNLAIEAEPLIRSADMLSVDLTAIRFADLPASSFYSPNGLTGDEICQLMRFAGMNERLSSLGIFGHSLTSQLNSFPFSTVSFNLVAQMVWYFLFGYFNRPNEDPYVDKSSFLKYIVTNDKLKTDLVFYKSTVSDRWWVEVPFSSKYNENFKRHLLLPCTYQDYQEALHENIPTRWLKTFQKFS